QHLQDPVRRFHPAAVCLPPAAYRVRVRIYGLEKREPRLFLRSNAACRRRACVDSIGPMSPIGHIVLLFSRFSTDTAVVNVAGKFAWQFEVVVDDVFEVDARCTGIGEERNQGRFALVLLVLGNATVVHGVAKSQTFQHLCLRQTKTSANLEQLFGKSLRPRTRIAHQKLPPDGSGRRILAVGSVLRSPLFVAVSMNLSCSTAMLITL